MRNETLVYLNKVFSNNKSKSYPIMENILLNSENSVQKLTFSNENECDCCKCSSCNDFFIDESSTFTIEKSRVDINSLFIQNPSLITSSMVTIDGKPVDSLEYINNRFIATTKNLLEGLPGNGNTRNTYMMISDAGPWLCDIVINLWGSVLTCGKCQSFKLCISSNASLPLLLSSTSTFAVPDLFLPCITDGIAPVVFFSFDGAGTVLNPDISVDSGNPACCLSLSCNLIAEPITEVQVTRETLFKTNADVVNIPCDNGKDCSICDYTEERDNNPAHKKNTPSNTICCQYNGCNGCR